MKWGSVSTGTRQRGGQRVEHLAAAHAAQIDQIPAVALEERLAARLANRREDKVASRLDVEHRDDELSKARLSEIVEQQLCVAPAQIGRRRLLGVVGPRKSCQSCARKWRRPGSTLQGAPTRRAHHRPRSRFPFPCAMCRSLPGCRYREHQKSRGQAQRHQPRDHRWQHARRKRIPHQVGIGRRQSGIRRRRSPSGRESSVDRRSAPSQGPAAESPAPQRRQWQAVPPIAAAAAIDTA